MIHLHFAKRGPGNLDTETQFSQYTSVKKNVVNVQIIGSEGSSKNPFHIHTDVIITSAAA